jgi:FkbM family methyltransferase
MHRHVHCVHDSLPHRCTKCTRKESRCSLAEFTLNGITLQIPDVLLTDQLTNSLQSGRYEGTETAALAKHLRPKDRFLDLGAGAGYLVALAGAQLKVAQVTGVEAGPDMVPVAQENLRRNGVAKGVIQWGAVVPDSYTEPEITFTVRPSFWASTLTPPEGAKNTREVAVPALRFGALLHQVHPTVVCIDIEGGELDLFATQLPESLRLIVIELHPGIYGKTGIKRIFDALSQQGFCYCLPGSTGGTVVFERLK